MKSTLRSLYKKKKTQLKSWSIVHLFNREAHGQSHQVRDRLSRNRPVSFLEGNKLWSLQHC